MGSVWAAFDSRLQRNVAVKMLPSSVIGGPDSDELISRFAREIKILTMLPEHPHIVEVRDHGHHLTPDGRQHPYIVMPLLRGSNLSRYVSAPPSVPMDRVLSWAQAIASALAVTHEQGVVHRDIKPENIFLANQAEGPAALKVLDFGIARLTDPFRTLLTKHGPGPFTPAYMAPEQLTKPEAVDGRTDLYSLGCVIHALLTGAPPFGISAESALFGHTHRQPTPLRQLSPDVPVDLEELVLALLAKAQEERPTVAAVRDRLGQLQQSFGVAAALSGPSGSVLEGSAAGKGPLLKTLTTARQSAPGSRVSNALSSQSATATAGPGHRVLRVRARWELAALHWSSLGPGAPETEHACDDLLEALADVDESEPTLWLTWQISQAAHYQSDYDRSAVLCHLVELAAPQNTADPQDMHFAEHIARRGPDQYGPERAEAAAAWLAVASRIDKLDAMDYLGWIVDICESALGRDHPQTAAALRAAAASSEASGDYHGALAWALQRAAWFERVLGHSNPDAAQARRDASRLLDVYLAVQGDAGAAEQWRMARLLVRVRPAEEEDEEVLHLCWGVLCEAMGSRHFAYEYQGLLARTALDLSAEQPHPGQWPVPPSF